ncbi:MAG: H(+)/Cl(-) exchange transporter ClcA [Verrucomicrobiota bacterium]
MHSRPSSGLRSASEGDSPPHLLRVALLSVVVGIITGGIASIFRIVLKAADLARTHWLTESSSPKFLRFLVAAALISTAAAIAAWLVRRFAPKAVGSGIPQVEAAVSGDAPPAGPSILPVKFIGGILAIGGGLALGREGPSVQMGAALGTLAGRYFRLGQVDTLALLAAGAGAGLATAFNAPIAGAVLVLEELVRRYDPRIALAALGASGGAIAVSRPLLGQAPDFAVTPIDFTGPASGAGFLFLGLVCGLAGVGYNRLLLAILAVVRRLEKLPVEARAASVGLLIAVTGWVHPDWIGGGEAVTHRALTAGYDGSVLLVLLGVRIVLSLLSYAAGTPGGLVCSLLAIGSLLGLVVSRIFHQLEPHLTTPDTAFALVGMGALLVATVRAPATGLVLITELTGNVTLLLPMLAACFVAMLVPSLLKCDPIYDSLREHSQSPRYSGLPDHDNDRLSS